MTASENEKIPGIFRSEMALWIGIVTALIFLFVGKNWLMDLSNPLKYGFFYLAVCRDALVVVRGGAAC